ncbi:MAG: 30S ribosomal protein S12 methylthiotransferase RimO [Candidatus Marinimicrobia bacterium]|nr:30S ribosomal protein S12 methylthiotransferase RimO [Candidatus Neomarinimicrobiota bacterium]MBT3936029.1 30S ribosomal protein S12 methylthiotransferase RimO [Candidatus Neomarinimicrobiota bacterium]MBT3960476.1 30S ribosomal protein S12 methylthiotransferase RimO [Candidatus Neomarinimicrobiota bacterium]MBT4383726.1 30S ribosomal protein S12 methylthiotransferase RimO [Candidatus Neomarinimicrobiota bacterium]MBT4636248.1 30S ribosomal protein S12 methylthiotransferase RimO [Candidatus
MVIKKLNLISLGCAKNLVDSEILLGGLKNQKIKIVNNPEKADSIVINTCGFLDIAREESVDAILQAVELKNQGTVKELVVMGCLSERYPNQLKEEIPEVDRFFGSNDHQLIASFLTGKEFSKDDPLFYRSLMTPSHYAYLKIAEGCDNGCTFCSIPLMRGKQKSRSISAIMNEAERLVNGGVKELLVIAQDTTSYGWDLQSKDYLDGLIRELNTLGDELDWIRVHYAHPAHLSQKIIDAMADSKKVCRYLDMPIQHASDDILQSMKRGLGQNGIKDRINRLRSAIPDIRLRTTLITGYPGETEKDYHELKNFIEEVEFDRLGIFTYSEEDDTLAANLDDNVPRQVKDDRRNELLDIQNEIALKKNEELVGKQLKVLVDESSESISVARTEYDSPEVDNIVRLDGSHKVGSFIDVIIDSVNEYELFASIIQ